MLDRYKVVFRVLDIELVGSSAFIIMERLVDANGVLLEGVGGKIEQIASRKIKVDLMQFVNQYEVVSEE